MSSLRDPEAKARQATGLLAGAMRRYADPSTSVSDAEGTAALVAAWNAKAKANPDAQPATMREIIMR